MQEPVMFVPLSRLCAGSDLPLTVVPKKRPHGFLYLDPLETGQWVFNFSMKFRHNFGCAYSAGQHSFWFLKVP